MKSVFGKLMNRMEHLGREREAEQQILQQIADIGLTYAHKSLRGKRWADMEHSDDERSNSRERTRPPSRRMLCNADAGNASSSSARRGRSIPLVPRNRDSHEPMSSRESAPDDEHARRSNRSREHDASNLSRSTSGADAGNASSSSARRGQSIPLAPRSRDGNEPMSSRESAPHDEHARHSNRSREHDAGNQARPTSGARSPLRRRRAADRKAESSRQHTASTSKCFTDEEWTELPKEVKQFVQKEGRAERQRRRRHRQSARRSQERGQRRSPTPMADYERQRSLSH